MHIVTFCDINSNIVYGRTDVSTYFNTRFLRTPTAEYTFRLFVPFKLFFFHNKQ